MAVVTGANRGIGLEVCRQLAAAGQHVVLGSRNAAARSMPARIALPRLGASPIQGDNR